MSLWEKSYLKNLNTDNVLTSDENGEFTVKGYEENIDSSSTLIYWAANPPTYNGSFTGSGLPFPSAEIAYENSSNRGKVRTTGGHYEFKINFPNSYYTDLGNNFVEPCVHIKIVQPYGKDIVKTIILNNSIPFRTLRHSNGERSNASRLDNSFYIGRDTLPFRSQEDILRDSGYPPDNTTPVNFWGKSIPHP